MVMKNKQPKPRVDYTKKARADRRKAFLDAMAVRWGLLDWGKFTQWARECAEEPSTDQGVNNRARQMLLSIANSIPGGDPNSPPADMDKIRELYPVGGRAVKMLEDYETPNLSPKTMERIQAGIEKYSGQDEAGRLAARPKADEVFSDATIQRDSQERAHPDWN